MQRCPTWGMWSRNLTCKWISAKDSEVECSCGLEQDKEYDVTVKHPEEG